MDENKIQEILKRYNAGTCSAEEKAWVESWYLQQIDESDTEMPDMVELDHVQQRIWKAISTERPAIRPKRYLYRKLAVTASVLLALSFAFYFLRDNTKDATQRIASLPVEEAIVKPGGNKAYLTLADGKRINLTDMEDGTLSEQEGVKIHKTAEGELIYEISDLQDLAGMHIGHNIIETPIGGQYQVLLPDGTKVWLNSSSSLKYPVRFAQHERKVVLHGEAYFEVNTDKKRPFRVFSEGQTIEVLGTKFNVNTYRDEPAIKTTLLEGSVRVSQGATSKVLRPGEQAAIIGQDIRVYMADIEQVTGWYKGDFVFNGVELKNIMRQISRWYDVEVVYQHDIGDVKFGGSISRSKDIHEVLKVLSMTKGVNFKLEGRRVLVMQ